MHPAWLLLAVLLQIGTYACAAGAWQRVLSRQHIRTSLCGQPIPLGLAKLFMDQVVPSAGLSGTLLVVRALKRRGVPDGASVSAVVVGLLGFHLAYGLALVTALVLLAVSGDLSRRMLSLAILASFLIGAMILGAARGFRGEGRGPVRARLMHIPGLKGFLQELHDAPKEALHDKTLLLQTTVLQFGIFLLDAATLGVCLAALAATASPTGLFAALVIASLVATITIIPSGLGTFDATMLAMLHLVGVSTTHGVGAGAVLGVHVDAAAPSWAVAGAPEMKAEADNDNQYAAFPSPGESPMRLTAGNRRRSTRRCWNWHAATRRRRWRGSTRARRG